MKTIHLLFVPVLFSTFAHGEVEPNGSRSRHALIFGIDGCRSDALKLAVETGKAPHIAKLIESGTVTWTAYAGGELDKPTQQATLSGPGWSSVFTGVWHDKHGVTDNSFRGANFNRYPNFLERLRATQPQTDIASLVSWPPIHDHLFKPVNESNRCTCHTYSETDSVATEEKLIANTIWTLSSGDPGVVFCYQGNIDHVGHTHGFSPEVPEYMEAIRLSDERIGEVLAAVRRRPGFAHEDWLFVVVTDHGGIQKVHGGQTPEERIIPLIVSGGVTPVGLVSDAVIGHTTVPATVMRHLGVEVAPSWGLDGKAFPVIETLDEGSTRPAKSPVLSLTQAALEKVDPEIKSDHYDITRTDLNADGKEDVLALMNGRSGYRGSGGATMFVLKGITDGFDSLGSIRVVNEPIYARKSLHNGFRDLLVTVSGGGAKPGLAALQFDGKKYPASPGEATAKVEETDELLFAEPTPPFDKKETLQGITFHVFSPNNRNGNRITVTPAGLEEDNRPIEMDVTGLITRIEVADINADGSPELYVYGFDGTSQGLLAWSANKRKSLSSITLPDLDAAQSAGHRGGDEFAVVEGLLGRRFPIYPDDRPDSKPTGKVRQIQYKLHPGETGWLLKPDKFVEF